MRAGHFSINGINVMTTWILRYPQWILLLMFLAACAPQPPISSPGHINDQQITEALKNVPPVVSYAPILPPPTPIIEEETYTVVIEQVPVRELLFALVRDSKINVDVHPSIEGTVTLNAVNQTLTQILDRLSHQVKLRYELQDNLLSIMPDEPIMRMYQVDYVNMTRESKGELTVDSQVSSSASASNGGSKSTFGNASKTQITNTSKNNFWESLRLNITALLSIDEQNNTGGIATISAANNVIINPETGVVVVRATSRQHEKIQAFINRVVENARRQVLIEATIAEVRLSDAYQAGIDWQRISGDYAYAQTLIPSSLSSSEAPFYSFSYKNPDSVIGDISANLRMLEQFGNVKVLSSPKIMALNNQTAVLKVVDDKVYFEIEVDITTTGSDNNNNALITYETNIKTVPVGLTMTVTPQINDSGVVTLNVRPTISRVIGFVSDPNPSLADADVVSQVPEIQVREVESILAVNNRDVAVIGGLMQDSNSQARDGIPVLSRLPVIGDLFSYRNDEYQKTELVIFLRPTVVKHASINSDLAAFKAYLPSANAPDNSPNTGLMLPR